MFKRIVKKISYELQFNNTKYFTRFSDKVLKTIYQHILENKVASLTPIALNHQSAKLTLAILANKKRFYESIAALYSFCFWDNNIYIHYHEDGTLSSADIDLLKNVFPGITIFKRSEQTLKTKKYLLSKGLIYAARMHDCFLFSIKLIDMIIEKRTPDILHIDSDVLFFSKPDEIFEVLKNDDYNGCFNVDNKDSSTFSSETIAQYIDIPIIQCLNSGLFMHNFDEAFFTFINTVMKGEPDAVVSWHLEQTLFAMYASHKGSFVALPKKYDVLQIERSLKREIVSEHYCHNTGYMFHKDFIYKLYPLYQKN